MHHLAYILILFTSEVFCGSVLTTNTDLLAAIRQDLRRNNDDYVESTVQAVSEQTFASSKQKPPSTSQASVTLETKNLLTPNNIKTTNNVKTTLNPPAPFRRTFQSIKLEPITDKPKHWHKKIDPAQYLITIPASESKQTQFTRNFKKKGMGRKNDLYEPQRKTFKLKTIPSTLVEVRRVSESDDELKRVQGFLRELEEKEGQAMKQIPELQEVLTRSETQATTKEDKQQRMALAMSKINEAPMVAPLKQKPTVTIESSIEEPQAPWEIPRLETTRGLFNRVALKKQSSEQMPVLRSVTTKEASKPKLPAGKPKAEAKTGISEKTKLRQKSSDVNRINELRSKLREGIKLSSLPPGHLLDLWPAIGPRVHAMRMKNKLCQRSVMLNEGPKYDSKGGTYMPRFKPRLLGTRKVVDFHQTKPPTFLLPRCCNCCRKSVLGCE